MLLPAHRSFILELEKALLAIDSQVLLPYWKWSKYSDKPRDDTIFKTFSRDGSGKPVTDGVLGTKKLSVPEAHYLTRGIDKSGPIDTAYVPESTLKVLINSAGSYDSFRSTLESTAHY